METLKLSTTGFWAFWSRIALGRKANNLCLLGRTFIISLALLPFWILPGGMINYILSRKNNDNGVPYWLWALVSVCQILVGALMIDFSFHDTIRMDIGTLGQTWLIGLIMVIIAIICITTFILAIMGIVYGIDILIKRIRRNSKFHPVSVMKQYFNGVKEKHCKKIEWVRPEELSKK